MKRQIVKYIRTLVTSDVPDQPAEMKGLIAPITAKLNEQGVGIPTTQTMMEIAEMTYDNHIKEFGDNNEKEDWINYQYVKLSKAFEELVRGQWKYQGNEISGCSGKVFQPVLLTEEIFTASDAWFEPINDDADYLNEIGRKKYLWDWVNYWDDNWMYQWNYTPAFAEAWLQKVEA